MQQQKVSRTNNKKYIRQYNGCNAENMLYMLTLLYIGAKLVCTVYNSNCWLIGFRTRYLCFYCL